MSKTDVKQINKSQLLIIFDYLNVKPQHKAALIDVFIEGLSSYEAENKHELPVMTVRPKVNRINRYVESCEEFTKSA
jgi:hypothetical protein